MTCRQWLKGLPWSVVVLAVAIVVLGWLGIARAEELAEGSGRFFHRQLIWSLVGLAAMLAATAINYRRLAAWSYAAFGVSILLLAAVYVFPPVNGAQRWIRLGPVGLQPSEFAKLAFVLGLARYLMHRRSYRDLPGLLVPLAIVIVPVLLILKEPDLGTSLVFLPVLFAMLFTAGARPRHLAVVALAGAMLVPLLWSQMSREQRSRITVLAAQTQGGDRPNDDTYHLHQAKQLFALGGWQGSLWAGQPSDDLSVYFVPEAHTDAIVSILAERLGLLGFALLLALFVVLICGGLSIASATREPFGRLVAIGISALLAVQMLINTGMMVGLLPITGLALPLVSYGGSSLLANALALGLLLNIGMRPGYEVTNEPFQFAD